MERNLGMPSGCEVESATLHVPVNEELVLVEPRRTGMRERLGALRSRGVARVHDVQHRLGERGVAIRQTLSSTLASKQSQVSSSMSNNPMKWAGIAAGSGFIVGMIGRYVQHRNKRRPTLDIVVIDAMC